MQNGAKKIGFLLINIFLILTLILSTLPMIIDKALTKALNDEIKKWERGKYGKGSYH